MNYILYEHVGTTLISNNARKLNSADLLPKAFGMILNPNLHGKKSKNFQISLRTTGKNKFLIDKYVLSKYI